MVSRLELLYHIKAHARTTNAHFCGADALSVLRHFLASGVTMLWAITQWLGHQDWSAARVPESNQLQTKHVHVASRLSRLPNHIGKVVAVVAIKRRCLETTQNAMQAWIKLCLGGPLSCNQWKKRGKRAYNYNLTPIPVPNKYLWYSPHKYEVRTARYALIVREGPHDVETWDYSVWPAMAMTCAVPTKLVLNNIY